MMNRLITATACAAICAHTEAAMALRFTTANVLYEEYYQRHHKSGKASTVTERGEVFEIWWKIAAPKNDVVAFQEWAYGEGKDGVAKSQMKWGDIVRKQAGWEMVYDESQTRQGLAFAVNTKTVRVADKWFKTINEKGSKSYGALVVEDLASKEKLGVLNAHLPYDEDKVQTLKYLKTLFAAPSGDVAHWVVAGDFNIKAPRMNEDRGAFHADFLPHEWTEATGDLRIGSVVNVDHSTPRIDYIFTSPSLYSTNVQATPHEPSLCVLHAMHEPHEEEEKNVQLNKERPTMWFSDHIALSATITTENPEGAEL